MLLLNIEQEPILRQADPYLSCTADGVTQRVRPEIRLIPTILLVARHQAYTEGLRQVSRVIRYFQSNPVFDPQEHRALGNGIGRLIVELATQSQDQQTDLWTALKVPTLPSVQYRVKMLVFRDPQPRPTTPVSDVTSVVRNEIPYNP